MQSVKEVLELLNKAKDIRLNIAIFLVVSGLLYSISNQYIQVDDALKTVLQGLFFITSIRLVYGFIGLLYGAIESNVESKRKLKLSNEEKDQRENDRKMKINKMRENFESLDIFQLYIVQELKRQNHIDVMKGATLFTLKNMNIIYTPATGEKYESASLTDMAMVLLNEELWEKYDTLKLSASLRFFRGMQPEDARHFIEFRTKDSINTQRSVKTATHSTHYENERVFNTYSKSVIFVQPRRGYIYIIDPAAKKALNTIFPA